MWREVHFILTEVIFTEKIELNKKSDDFGLIKNI